MTFDRQEALKKHLLYIYKLDPQNNKDDQDKAQTIISDFLPVLEKAYENFTDIYVKEMLEDHLRSIKRAKDEY